MPPSSYSCGAGGIKSVFGDAGDFKDTADGIDSWPVAGVPDGFDWLT